MASVSIATADSDELFSMLESSAEELELKEEQQGNVGAAMRLVETFSSLMKKKFWLRNTVSPYTDGFEIAVPFRHKFMYQYTEHELAHNLFQSSFAAKELFCQKYVELIESVIKKQNRRLTVQQKSAITDMVGLMLNVLEDHRINTLWSTMYEGSYAIMQEQAKELLKRVVKPAKDDLIAYFLLVANDHPKLPKSRFSHFEPHFREAIKKVAYKGPTATFVVGKWLLTQMVSTIIDQQQQDQQQQSGQGNGQSQQQGQQQQDGESQDGQQDGQQQDDSPSSSGGAPSAQPADSGSSGGAKPTPDQRIDALMQLVNDMARTDAARDATNRMEIIVGDVRADRFQKDKYGAEAKVNTALRIDMADEAIESFLRTSEAEMQTVLKQIESVLESSKSSRSEDDLLKRGLAGKVTFTDVKNPVKPPSMPAEDRHTAARLSERFRRVHSSRKSARFDSGSSVDLASVIYNQANGTNEPCFLEEATGRGFQVMILVDQSGSMGGLPSHQASRACRILRRALKGPNITFDVWGFNGGSGTVITRLPTNKDVDEAKELQCGGSTPLAQAMHVAVNFLSRGTHKKHLLVLTDGEPNALNKGGGFTMNTERSAVAAVGAETKRARKMGVNVTGIAIGNSVTVESLKTMFGADRHWMVARSPTTLPQKMLQTVSSSFASFLRNA
jgi:Mg-chelatase subunit ChlD